MRAFISQPAYFPWLGLLDRIERSDVFIVFDTAQFVHKTSILFQNRNKIRAKGKITPEGRLAGGWQWMTVPVVNDGNEAINKVKIDGKQNWEEKHWKAILFNYARAKRFSEYKMWLEKFYAKNWQLLIDLNMASMNFLMRELGIKTKVVLASDIEKKKLKGTDHLIHLCQQAGADEYLSGPYGKEYLEKGKFEVAGIKIVFHEFKHPEYKQAFPGFEPGLSALDLLLNHGKESRNIMGWD